MLFVEADEIVPQIWQGPWPGTGRYVASSGFGLLVLCAQELQEPAESFPDVKVVYAPNYDDGVHDLTRDLLKVAIEAARQVEDAYRQGIKCLITCRAGLNRSGLVTGLALHMIFGWDGRTCVRRVQRMRKPYQGVKPLSNRQFVRALYNLKQTTDVPSGWQEGPGGILVPV
jgi:protein-tyrosine phosphatase